MRVQSGAAYSTSPCSAVPSTVASDYLTPRVTSPGVPAQTVGCLASRYPSPEVPAQTVGCLTPRFTSPGVHTQTPRQGVTSSLTQGGLAQAQWPGTTRSGFSIEDLQVGIGGCDPTQEPLRSQILAKLGLSKQARVEKMGGCGGLNEGIWAVQDPSSRSSLVLKLVRSQGAHGTPSEADRFARIFSEHPSIENDPTVAFPIKVFKCIGHLGSNAQDFIVTRKVSGQPLGDVLALKRSSGRTQEIMQILRQLGSFLARFHKSYGNKQHGDFQPSNIFYDASSGAFAMIDIADLGHNSLESDVSHFCQSLRILSRSFGQQFYNDGTRNFQEGYRDMR